MSTLLKISIDQSSKDYLSDIKDFLYTRLLTRVGGLYTTGRGGNQVCQPYAAPISSAEPANLRGSLPMPYTSKIRALIGF